MKAIEKNYRLAVRNAIKGLHAAGLPAHQIRNGQLVAIYPDGREQVLKELPESKENGKAGNIDSRRTQRRGKIHAGANPLS
jgi:hypothetical protein